MVFEFGADSDPPGTGDDDLTDAQIPAISCHKDVRTLPRYVQKIQAQNIAGTRKRRAARADQDSLSE